MWQVAALQPAAAGDIIAASPFAPRSRALAPVQLMPVVPDGGTYQKFPLVALHAEYDVEAAFTATSMLGFAARVPA